MASSIESAASPASTASFTTHPSAVLIPAPALPASLLCVTPFVIHVKARNLAASFLVGRVAVVNFFNFLNAVIWPDDSSMFGYDGTILCDAEVKPYVGITAGVTGAIASVFRQLALLLDPGRPMGSESKIQTTITRVFEIGTCFGLAIYSMAAHYVVQPDRYILEPIEGCVPPIWPSWLAFVLIAMWPLVMSLVAVGYCVLALSRLLKHRQEVSSVLSASKTTKSHYYRLFTLATLLLLGNLPLSIFATLVNMLRNLQPYEWPKVYPPLWSVMIRRIPFEQLQGRPGFLTDRYIQIADAYILFAFFGLGDEARAVYKLCAEQVGIAKLWRYLMRKKPTGKWRKSRQRSVDTIIAVGDSQVSTFIMVPKDEIDIELAQIDEEIDDFALPARHV